MNVIAWRSVFVLLCGWLSLLGSGCLKSDLASAEASERSSALYRSAFAAEQSGDIDEAIRLYNKVLIEEPKSFSAHFQLATLLHDHKEDYIGAIYHYNQYLYLRPESEKSTLAQERIRIAEQLLAPQILRKVGDSVQGISQAHLLKENDRLNRIITTLEGEKSVLTEEKTRSEKELAALRSDNARLREILARVRSDDSAPASESLLKRVEAAVLNRNGEEAAIPAKTDAKTLRALREEASNLAKEGASPAGSAVPSTEAVLKKVQTRLEEQPAAVKDSDDKKRETSSKLDKTALANLSPFKRKEKKEPEGEPRTYVVQPGDTLFRVAEKFYGDSTQWKKIREANRTRIDPDGRIRAGQIILVP